MIKYYLVDNAFKPESEEKRAVVTQVRNFTFNPNYALDFVVRVLKCC